MTMQSRVRGAVLLFLSVVVLVSSVAGVVLYVIDTEAEDVEYHWLPAIRIVSSIGDQVRGFRMDQAVPVTTEHTRAASEDVASKRGETIEALLQELATLPPATVDPAVRARVETTVRAYLASANAASPTAGSSQAGGGEAAALYAAADGAVTELSAFLHEQAYLHANHVDEAVDFAGVLLILSVLAFLTVAIEAGRRFNRHIIAPWMSSAERSQDLARGDRDVRIGFQDRRDEIGDLARACVAFRDSLGVPFDRREGKGAGRTRTGSTSPPMIHSPACHAGQPSRRSSAPHLRKGAERIDICSGHCRGRPEIGRGAAWCTGQGRSAARNRATSEGGSAPGSHGAPGRRPVRRLHRGIIGRSMAPSREAGGGSGSADHRRSHDLDLQTRIGMSAHPADARSPAN